MRMCATGVFARAEDGVVVVDGENEGAVCEREAFGE